MTSRNEADTVPIPTVAGSAIASDAPAPKVLLVGSAISGGGAETRLRLIAQHLFGGTADVAVLKSTDSALGPGQRLHPLGWAGSRSYPGILRRLRRAVRSHPYDAVLAFGLYPNTLAWAAVKGMRCRPALILTEITRPDAEARFAGGVRRAMGHVMRRVSYPGADLCAANSEDGVAEVVRCYSVDPRRIRRLPNLIEPDRIARLSAEDADGADAADPTPSICAVARLVPLKRIDTLLDAAALLPAGLAWRVDILGDGPERRALEALAPRLGIGSRVRFHGWTRNPYPAMRRALVTVLTSSYEGFSNTVLESMALGTPVITSFCSSDARQMVETGAALGFPIGDHRTLALQLTRVLREPNLRRDLSGRARAYAERHTLPSALREYEALVRDAVARMA